MVKCPPPHERLSTIPIQNRAKGVVGERGSSCSNLKKLVAPSFFVLRCFFTVLVRRDAKVPQRPTYVNL